MPERAFIPSLMRKSTCSSANATRSPAARSCRLPTSHPIRAIALSRAPLTPSITPRNLLAIFPCNRNIRVSDRGTLTNLLITSNGYALSTGVLSSEMQWGMASIPLADAPTMHVGYIMHDDRKPSPLLQQYLDELNRIIHAN